MAAGVALLDVAAEGSGAAKLDGTHGAQLPAAERIGMLLSIGRAEAAEDIGHLEP
jgi:hypothetical protein